MENELPEDPPPEGQLTATQLARIAADAGCSLQTARRAYAGTRVNAFNFGRLVEAAQARGLPPPPSAAQKGCAA